MEYYDKRRRAVVGDNGAVLCYLTPSQGLIMEALIAAERPLTEALIRRAIQEARGGNIYDPKWHIWKIRQKNRSLVKRAGNVGYYTDCQEWVEPEEPANTPKQGVY